MAAFEGFIDEGDCMTGVSTSPGEGLRPGLVTASPVISNMIKGDVSSWEFREVVPDAVSEDPSQTLKRYTGQCKMRWDKLNMSSIAMYRKRVAASQTQIQTDVGKGLVATIGGMQCRR
ncbi:hypothetical protein B0A52_05649 [Exophiala mesophila]|uniref:Uncharacterized protein n=1 Tax=Exophiala mesophila TaxID=212818 RepID=A0A438N3W3_EXOME|nr:hypothetical protein B0A52_05649 [Exophiala mesophila]